MKNLLEKVAYDEIVNRINQLTSSSQAQWGKMNVAQMLAHCAATMEVAVGDAYPKRSFMGYLLGGFMKNKLTSDEPYQKDLPTHESYIVVDEREFLKEKQRLLDLLTRFQIGGEAKVTTHPNPFFGKLSPMQWGMGMFKHLDHHLVQFGV